jgi:hypothetical protein
MECDIPFEVSVNHKPPLMNTEELPHVAHFIGNSFFNVCVCMTRTDIDTV